MAKSPAPAKQKEKVIDCLECHGDLAKGKSVHPAVSMGCDGCHTAVDAALIPHRIKNKLAKGLSMEQPGLCYGCHDKAVFTKKVVHGAIGMGCSICHNPHVSVDAASLLLQPVGKLCVTCHDKQASGKHVMAGYALGDDHPVWGKVDPTNSSRELSCISCHNPHSSSKLKLFANETKSPDSLCLMCHRKISIKSDSL